MINLLSIMQQAAAEMPAFTDTEPENFWMPPVATDTAAMVDNLYYAILAISTVSFIGITVATLWFVAKYRARPGHRLTKTADHNDGLELTWTILPSIVVAIIFVFGWTTFADMSTPPKHAMEVIVTGQKWNWQFQYPNGHIDTVLHVPVDEPVRLVMKSEDVIHSFYVPAFRIKQDVLPQRYTYLWFHANQTGVFRMYCTEYCGQQHSDMKTAVIVHPPGGYEQYLEEAEAKLMDLPPRELGALLYTKRGCQQCHSIDGKASTGPSLKGIFGAEHAMKDGSRVIVDENYIRESILDPQAKVRAGYNPVMPSFQGKLKDREITGIIEYIKSLE